MGESETYSGVPGAFPYAVGRSDSRLFRLYAVVGGVIAVLLALFFGFALVKAIADSVGGGGVSGYRALVVLFALAVVGPVVAPVLLVARRHRRSEERAAPPPAPGYDRLMGALGFAFLLAGYLALVISVPETYESEPTGPLAPLVAALYDAPAVASPLPPGVVALAMLLLDRLYGRRDPGGGGETDPT